MKTKKEQVKEEILNAAYKRFGYYGYSKTTMSEIAKDCSMSAANLYRYFRDKSAIGTEIARSCFERVSCLLQTVADTPDLTAEQKVKEYILTSVRYNFKEFEDSPEIMELVEHVCKEGTEHISKHRNKCTEILIAILAEGVKSGEFEIENLEETAISIRVATLVFHATPLFLMYKNFCAIEDEMIAMAEQVTELIFKGIRKGQ